MGAKIMPKLTQRMVDIRERPKTGQVIVRDEELTGFAVRFTPKSAAYVVECRFNGANRRLTIGKTDRMSLDEARAKAREHLNKMASGIDPDAEKKIQKQATITLREVLEVYLATKQLKPSTIDCYRLSRARDKRYNHESRIITSKIAGNATVQALRQIHLG